MADESGSHRGSGQTRREDISALLDGELASPAVDRVCVEWRTDSASRDVWHTYSLIGDVMRCEELASDAAHDAQFLQKFRTNMTTEPVVLAPSREQPAPRERSRTALPLQAAGGTSGHRWALPVSLAAGFMLVIGVMLLGPLQGTPGVLSGDAADMAMAPASDAGPLMNVSDSRAANAPAERPSSDAYTAGMELVFDGEVIRDPRLDRYLLAHKQFAGNSVLGPTSGLLRNAAVEVPAP